MNIHTFASFITLIVSTICLSLPVSVFAQDLGGGYKCVDEAIQNKKNKVIKFAAAKKAVNAQITVANKIASAKKRAAKKAVLKAVLANLKKCDDGGFIEQSLQVTIDAEQCTAKDYTTAIQVLPARKGRTVSLQISADNGASWTSLISGTDDGTGSTSVNFTSPETAGTYLYRVRAEQIGKTAAGTFTPIEAKVSPCGSTVVDEKLPLIRAGGVHTCILDLLGKAWCWGENVSGNLGDGTNTDRLTGVQVKTDLTFKSIALGYEHTCALTADGTAYCWGNNGSPPQSQAYTDDGMLGDGTNINRNVPTPVNTALKFKKLALGDMHSCGLTVNGLTYCWGSNYDGQIGNGDPLEKAGLYDKLLPTQVLGSANYIDIVAQEGSTCGLTAFGTVECWGYKPFGSAEERATRNRPEVQEGTGYIKLSLLNAGRCGLRSNGTIECWGSETMESFGNGPAGSNGGTPVQVVPQAVFSDLSIGGRNGCGLTAEGDAWCWGYNLYGEVGDGTGGNVSLNRHTPQKVIGGKKFAHLSRGYGHTCGITTGGGAFCWGPNHQGQLGNGAKGFTAAVYQPGPVFFTP